MGYFERAMAAIKRGLKRGKITKKQAGNLKRSLKAAYNRLAKTAGRVESIAEK